MSNMGKVQSFAWFDPFNFDLDITFYLKRHQSHPLNEQALLHLPDHASGKAFTPSHLHNEFSSAVHNSFSMSSNILHCIKF